MSRSLSLPGDAFARSAATSCEARVEAAFATGLWIAVAGSALVLGALLIDARLTVHPFVRDDLPYYICGIAALALRLRLRDARARGARAIACGAEWYALFTLVALMGAVATYPIAGASHGDFDPALQHVDRLLHFDWLAWYRTVAAHPLLQYGGGAAYQSIFLTPALLLGWFAWTGARMAAWRFLAAFWLAAVLTLIVFRFLPAVGPLATLWHGPVPYMPASGLWEPELIPALRDHMIHSVDLGALRGLVSSPSFHTEAAILYVVAAWPHRVLRAPLTLLNAAMLASTPVEGTHYLADMLTGAVVAVVAILAVAAAEFRVRREAARYSFSVSSGTIL